jgi:hypothetical protein
MDFDSLVAWIRIQKGQNGRKKKEKDLAEGPSEFEPCWPGKDTGQNSTFSRLFDLNVYKIGLPANA